MRSWRRDVQVTIQLSFFSCPLPPLLLLLLLQLVDDPVRVIGCSAFRPVPGVGYPDDDWREEEGGPGAGGVHLCGARPLPGHHRHLQILAHCYFRM